LRQVLPQLVNATDCLPHIRCGLWCRPVRKAAVPPSQQTAGKEPLLIQRTTFQSSLPAH
jgi:hypothetical protein